MEFFINHTHKQIAFAGNNAHLNKFLVKLTELVETKGWSFKDDIQLFIVDVDPYMTHENVRTLIEDKKYVLLDEEFWYVLFPEEDELAQQMIGEAYDREIAAEIARDDNRYGDRGWSGWDTPGATCDV